MIDCTGALTQCAVTGVIQDNRSTEIRHGSESVPESPIPGQLPAPVPLDAESCVIDLQEGVVDYFALYC